MTYGYSYIYPTLAQMWAGTVGPAAPDEILQSLIGGTEDGLKYTDALDIVNPEPEVRDVNVLNFAAGGTITAAGIIPADILTQEGSASLTAGTGTITVGIGTVSQISVNGVLRYTVEEGSSLYLYDVFSTTVLSFNTFESNVNQESTKYSVFPIMYQEEDSGDIVIRYNRADDHNGTNSVSYKSTSVDDGVTWGAPEEETQYPLSIRAPKILVASGGIQVSLQWITAALSSSGFVEAQYSYSTDYGTTWSTPQVAAPATENWFITNAPILLDNGDIVFSIYKFTGVVGAYCVRTNVASLGTLSAPIPIDLGADISEVSQVFFADTGETRSYIRINDSAVIHMSISTDNGLTWGAFSTPSFTVGAGSYNGNPVVYHDVANDLCILSTRKDSNFETVFYYSSDRGATWDRQEFPYAGLGKQMYSSFLCTASGRLICATGLEQSLSLGYINVNDFAEISVTNPPVTFTSGAWTTSDIVGSHNHLDGHTPAVYGDGAGQYVNTGVANIVAQDFDIEMEYVYVTASGTGAIFGCMDDPAANRLMINFSTTAVSTWLGGTSLTYLISPTVGDTVKARIKRTGNTLSLFVNDVESTVDVTGEVASTHPIWLFGRDRAGVLDLPSTIVIKYCTIEVAGVLERDYIPYGTGQFYDRVYGTVVGNGGTGTLANNYIPALSAGTLAADGSAITNPPGVTHNLSEVGVQQTAAFNVFGASASYYGNGVDTWDKKTIGEWITFYASINGTLNLWIQMKNGVITRADQYSLAYTLTVDEILQNESFYGGGFDFTGFSSGFSSGFGL